MSATVTSDVVARTEKADLDARSSDPRVNVSDVLGEAFGTVGTAGDDRIRAAGQIPLGRFEELADDRLGALVSTSVAQLFTRTMTNGGERS